MSYWMFLILLPILIFSTPVFAQTDMSISDYSQYILEIDDHSYPITYDVNADIIAMQIDSESKSLLIGLDKTYDSKFYIKLDHEMINAQNNEFVVLVNGQDTDYEITSDSTSSTLLFYVSSGDEEVEIIGTSVIPEFPIGAIFGLAIMVFSMVVFAKIKTPFFKL